VTIWDHGAAGRLPISHAQTSHAQTNRVRCTTFQIFFAVDNHPFLVFNENYDQKSGFF
jgi:hypothetical protein